MTRCGLSWDADRNTEVSFTNALVSLLAGIREKNISCEWLVVMEA
jgi:hypothetical protein